MIEVFANLAHRIGMDKAIAYSSGSRIIGGVTGVLSVFFISTFLTGVEQGFYYTFGSILALQVFFELGLTGIMTQYVAHEASHLRLNADNQYEGEEKYRSRLASLVHFCVKWYSVLAILVFVFILIIGLFFFQHYGEDQSSDASWRIPWVLICAGTAIKLFQSPFTSIYMGIGKVKEMSKIGFYQQLILPVSTWIGLACGLKLYVMGIGYVLSVLVWQIYVYRIHLDVILLKLWKENITERVDYFKEIFPYQWRIALSWVSGYFVFQLFNPVLFATEGAIVAGQMGMTMQALNAINSIPLSWLSTKVPMYSQLIALRNYVKLDEIFNKTLSQMVLVCSFILFFFLLFIWFLNISQFHLGNGVLADRFLGYYPLILLMIKIVLQQYVQSWATYLRCHKKEPFLILSVVGGIVDGISIPLMAYYLGLNGMVTGYFFISLLSFPWAYYIYKTKKTEWHGTY